MWRALLRQGGKRPLSYDTMTYQATLLCTYQTNHTKTRNKARADNSDTVSQPETGEIMSQNLHKLMLGSPYSRCPDVCKTDCYCIQLKIGPSLRICNSSPFLKNVTTLYAVAVFFKNASVLRQYKVKQAPKGRFFLFMILHLL